MAELVWTSQALENIARLHDFLAPKNADAARRAIRTIRRGARILAVHPEIGRPREDMPPGHREWFIRFGNSGYMTLYSYDGQRVAILAVRHAREAGYSEGMD